MSPNKSKSTVNEGARRKRRAPRRVSVAVLSTGSEILQGLYVDTNAQWLAQRLDECGYDVTVLRTVSDDLKQAVSALRSLQTEVDLIISTGALGPTEDDRFRDACAEAWERPLKHSADLEAMIQQRFTHSGRVMPESNRRQALLPQRAVPLENRWGTAPGFIIPPKRGSAGLIALPGPPVEMKPMWEKAALPWLQGHLWPGIVRQRATFHTIGWSESHMNDVMADIFTIDPNLDVTMLARSGKIDIRLTATGNSEREAKALLTKHRQTVKRRLPQEIIFATNDETLEEVIYRLCHRHGLKIAVAESCTGGLIAQRLTSVAGASRILTHSVITYANEAKHRVLGVKPTTLSRQGAVSEECVCEMAEGVREWSGSDIGLAISGIAGPKGGTKEKPVGLVHWAVSTNAGTRADHFICIRKERDSIRLWSADRALNAARRAILDLVRRQ